jgi:hypothetical protein
MPYRRHQRRQLQPRFRKKLPHWKWSPRPSTHFWRVATVSRPANIFSPSRFIRRHRGMFTRSRSLRLGFAKSLRCPGTRPLCGTHHRPASNRHRDARPARHGTRAIGTRLTARHSVDLYVRLCGRPGRPRDSHRRRFPAKTIPICISSGTDYTRQTQRLEDLILLLVTCDVFS